MNLHHIRLSPMPLRREIEAFDGPVGWVNAMRRLAALDGAELTIPAEVAALLKTGAARAPRAAGGRNGPPREALLSCRHITPVGSGRREFKALYCPKCLAFQKVEGVYERGEAPRGEQ